MSPCLWEAVTFVSDEVSAEDDEEAKQDKDDDSHYPSDHGVVHPRSRRHGCGVLRKGRAVWKKGEERGEGGKKRRHDKEKEKKKQEKMR